MWRTLKRVTECTKSAVMLDGELSEFYNNWAGILTRVYVGPNTAVSDFYQR